MVLQIGAHAGQVLFNFNAVLLEQRCRSDARELQDLRRADAAGAQQNFAAQPARVARGQRLDALATAPDLNARAALAAIVLFFNDQAAHLRAGPHFKVGPAKAGRAQKGFGRVPAKAAFLVDFEIAHTFVVAGVEVVSRRNSGLLRRQREGVQNVPAQALLFHAPFAADFLGQALAAGVLAFVAVQSPEVFVDLALRCVKLVVVLVHAKAGQRAVPAPDIVAGEFGPALVVARLAAHVDHAVDAGRAAQRLAARVAQRAAVQAGFCLGLVEPVGARVADAMQVAHRNVDPVVVVAPAGLDHQHPLAGVGAQAVGEQTTGGAAADDDVVEGGVAHGVSMLSKVKSGARDQALPRKTGNSLLRPSAISSTASAARTRPISRVITLIPVLPSARAIGPASEKHSAVASATTTP